MKTPPQLDPHLTRAAELSRQRDSRFLLFIGLALAAMAIGLKSELLTQNRVWLLGVALFAVASAALALYLRTEREAPRFEHFIPAVLGVLALTGLSFDVPEWWRYLMVAVGFAVAFFLTGFFDYQRLRENEKPGHGFVQDAVLGIITVAAYLVVLSPTSPLNLPGRLVGIFLVSALATFRSFRVTGHALSARRAFFFSLLVAQVVTFLAWAMSVYVLTWEGLFAGMLLLAWYINRGVIRHAVEETLSRRVVAEFGVLALFFVYLFWTNIQPPG